MFVIVTMNKIQCCNCEETHNVLGRCIACRSPWELRENLKELLDEIRSEGYNTPELMEDEDPLDMFFTFSKDGKECGEIQCGVLDE